MRRAAGARVGGRANLEGVRVERRRRAGPIVGDRARRETETDRARHPRASERTTRRGRHVADRGAARSGEGQRCGREPRGATRATAAVRESVGIVASAFIAARSAMWRCGECARGSWVNFHVYY